MTLAISTVSVYILNAETGISNLSSGTPSAPPSTFSQALQYPLIILVVLAAYAYGSHCGKKSPRPFTRTQPSSASIANFVYAPGPSHSHASSLEDVRRATYIATLLEDIMPLYEEITCSLEAEATRNSHIAARREYTMLVFEETASSLEEVTRQGHASVLEELELELADLGTKLGDALYFYYRRVDRTSPRVGNSSLNAL